MSGHPNLRGAVIVLVSLACSGAMAQEQNVMGHVATSDGKPVLGYPIVITGNGNQFVAISDEDGNFVVPSVPPGEYEAIPPNDTRAVRAFKLEPSEDTSSNSPMQWFLGPKSDPMDAPVVDIGTITVGK